MLRHTEDVPESPPPINHQKTKKQPRRALLLALMGTTALLLVINQAYVKSLFQLGWQQFNLPYPVSYSPRHIQDYHVGLDDVTRQRPPLTNQDGTATEGKTAAAVAEETTNNHEPLITPTVEHVSAHDLKRESTPRDNLEEVVEWVLHEQRILIREAMEDQSFHPSLNAKLLEDLQLESGGRSRSSFKDQDGTAQKGKAAAELSAEAKNNDGLLLGAAVERMTAHDLKKESTPTETLEETVQRVLNGQRAVIREAMEGYSFHPSLNVKRLEDLQLESGGRPVRSIVVSTWRSGSSFVGDVLDSHPATYYHYEPLLGFGLVQVRHGEAATEAVQTLRRLLTCDYSNLDHYLKSGTTYYWTLSRNKRLWAYCVSFPDICSSARFLTSFCKLFPFQSIKTVRMRLNLTTEILQDKDLGVQVLLLVRDPRGIMQSRRNREWCPGNPDCNDPAWLCRDLVSDFHTAKKFLEIFPNSFRVIRYEDLSFYAYNMTRELFEFFHLSYHPEVEKFLDTHTKKNIGGAFSTFRDSKTAPIQWQQDLSWVEVKSIQSVCGEALRLWGYRIAKDEKHFRSFNPVGKFKITA